jgi:hypothetical protein
VAVEAGAAEGWKPVRRAQERSSRRLRSMLFPAKGGTRGASSSPPPAPSAGTRAGVPQPVVHRELGID